MNSEIHLVTCIRHPASGFICTPEHLAMQQDALNSWAAIGSTVHIVAKPGQVLWRDLALELVKHPVAAQIDSDIILTAAVREVFQHLGKIESPAWATSHRRQFPVGSKDPVGESVDICAPYGLSIFVGNQAFWSKFLLSDAIEFSKLGVTDDQAVCSFGNVFYSDTAFDFTDRVCVFHPDHGDRIACRSEFNLACTGNSNNSGIPGNKL